MRIKYTNQFIKYIVILLGIITINLTVFAESTIVNPDSQKSDAISKEPEEILAQGTVVAIDSKKQQMTINHKAIPELKWPAMTMSFPVANAVKLTDFKVGDYIQFTITKSNKDFMVMDIKKLPG